MSLSDSIAALMESLTSKYLALYPVKDINFQCLFPADLDYFNCSERQLTLLQATLQHSRGQQYPPHNAYISTFLKKLIQQLENSGHEVRDEIYSTYTALLNNGPDNSSTGCYCYRTYTLPCGALVTLRETTNIIAEGTTGLCTWQASHVLLRHLLLRPQLLRGKRVLELGSGLGLLGISLLLSHRSSSKNNNDSNGSSNKKYSDISSYHFTDLHPTVLATLSDNVKRNLILHFSDMPLSVDVEYTTASSTSANNTNTSDISTSDISTSDSSTSANKTSTSDSSTSANNSSTIDSNTVPSQNGCAPTGVVSVRRLDWEEVAADKRAPTVADLPPCDLLLAADVVFDPTLYEPLIQTIRAGLSDGAGGGRAGETRDCSADCTTTTVPEDNHQLRLTTGSKLAIIAATVRNEDALDTFISSLEPEGLRVCWEEDQLYQLSPSQPQHRVRILYLQLK